MAKKPQRMANTDSFKRKPAKIRTLINESLDILSALGIPMGGLTPRRKERMAMAFMAVADIRKDCTWSDVKDLDSGRSMKTRDIINYINGNYHENISSGSYDDIRRKDLKLPVLAGLIIHANPNTARNDSTRGYALNPAYAEIIRKFGNTGWEETAEQFIKGQGKLADALAANRNIPRIPICLPDGQTIVFSPGTHNELQRNIVEDFLPRFGFGAEVLYIGDAAKKHVVLNKIKLAELNFFELDHGELPDIVAYSKAKNWLFLIEAFHTSGPIDKTRLHTLKMLTKNCSAGLIFVTAFATAESFKKHASQIAWETEVWIADNPDHMIHFDGEKFLGPYGK